MQQWVAQHSWTLCSAQWGWEWDRSIWSQGTGALEQLKLHNMLENTWLKSNSKFIAVPKLAIKNSIIMKLSPITLVWECGIVTVVPHNALHHHLVLLWQGKPAWGPTVVFETAFQVSNAEITPGKFSVHSGYSRSSSSDSTVQHHNGNFHQIFHLPALNTKNSWNIEIQGTSAAAVEMLRKNSLHVCIQIILRMSSRIFSNDSISWRRQIFE